MALIGIKIPESIGKLLNQIEVPGKKEPHAEMHITMFYFEGALSIKQIMDICNLIIDTLENLNIFDIKFQNISSFPKGDDGIPIKVDVESPGLIELRKTLAKKLNKEDLKFSNKFPNYSPHITLSYSEDEDIDSFKLEKEISMSIGELVIWGGDSFENGICVIIPFKLNNKKLSKTLFFSNLLKKFSAH